MYQCINLSKKVNKKKKDIIFEINNNKLLTSELPSIYNEL